MCVLNWQFFFNRVDGKPRETATMDPIDGIGDTVDYQYHMTHADDDDVRDVVVVHRQLFFFLCHHHQLGCNCPQISKTVLVGDGSSDNGRRIASRRKNDGAMHGGIWLV